MVLQQIYRLVPVVLQQLSGLTPSAVEGKKLILWTDVLCARPVEIGSVCERLFNRLNLRAGVSKHPHDVSVWIERIEQQRDLCVRT